MMKGRGLWRIVDSDVSKQLLFPSIVRTVVVRSNAPCNMYSGYILINIHHLCLIFKEMYTLGTLKQETLFLFHEGSFCGIALTHILRMYTFIFVHVFFLYILYESKTYL